MKSWITKQLMSIMATLKKKKTQNLNYGMEYIHYVCSKAFSKNKTKMMWGVNFSHKMTLPNYYLPKMKKEYYFSNQGIVI